MSRRRRFRLCDRSYAISLGWEPRDEELIFTSWNNSHSYTYTMVNEFWDGDKPGAYFLDMEEEEPDLFSVRYTPGIEVVYFGSTIIPLMLLIEIKDDTEKGCICDIKALFSCGCKCGGFQREKSRSVVS